MRHLMILVFLAVFFEAFAAPLVTWADLQHRKRVLVGKFASGADKDREVVRGMVHQRLEFLPHEIGVDRDRWPYFEQLRAELGNNLPTTVSMLKQKWSQTEDLLALMHGVFYSDENVFSCTIVVGEDTPGFKVEIGFTDFPRKSGFRRARDATALLLYYALLKDARQKDLPEPDIIRPMLTVAREILTDMEKTVNDPWVKYVADDLEKLQNLLKP